MKKIMKKILAMVLGIILMLVANYSHVMTIELLAEENVEFEYSVNSEGTITLNKYIGSDKDVVIPDSINGVTVTEIDYIPGVTFFNGVDINSVYIPSRVNYIGNRVFSECDNLTEINVAENNWYYSSENGILFDKDKTILYKFPAGKTDTEYVIPESVDSVWTQAFYECDNLVKVICPENMEMIRMEAFSGCDNLTYVEMPKTYGDNIGINNLVFAGCAKLEKITLPDGFDVVGEYFFKDCTGLKEVVIPESVGSINAYSFSNCTGLKNITIPASVKFIEDSAFESCTNLSEITFVNDSNSMLRFGEKVFANCNSLTDIMLPVQTKSVNAGTFDGCTTLNEVNVDENCVKYRSEDGVLILISSTNGDSLLCYPGSKKGTEYTILGSVSKVGKNAFNNVQELEKLIIPDTIEMKASAVYNCPSLSEVVFEDGITAIAGISCCPQIKTINIPDSVTTLSGFDGCTGLTSVTIPKNVKQIKWQSFFECLELESVIIENDEVEITNPAFKGIDKLIIYANIGSTAEAYAKENEIQFSDLVLVTPAPTETPTSTPVATPTPTPFTPPADIPMPTGTETSETLGDVNNDKMINSTDALLVLRHAAKISVMDSIVVADVNADGNANSADALMILQYAAKIINSF